MSADFAKMMGLQTIEEVRKNASKKRMLEGKGCPLCDYSGYVYNENGKSSMCSCAKEKFYRELFIKANIPRAYLNKTLDDWNTRTDSLGRELGNQQIISERVYTLLKHYDKKMFKICGGESIKITHTGGVTTNLHSLNFEGSVGSGKTFLASVMIQSAIRQGLPAKYYDWSELISMCSDFNKKPEIDEIAEEFKNLDLVAIDGIEIYSYSTPVTAQNLDRIFKARMNSGKPTLLFSIGNVSQIQGGSGWQSLLSKCLVIRLPQAIS
jgi:hypothetical protein